MDHLSKDFASPESTSLHLKGRWLNRPSYLWMQNTNRLSLGHHKKGPSLGWHCWCWCWGTADAETAEPPSTQVNGFRSKDGSPKMMRKKPTQNSPRTFQIWYQNSFSTQHIGPKTFQWSFFSWNDPSNFGCLFFSPKASLSTLSALPFRRWFHRVRHNVHTMEVMIYQRWAASKPGGSLEGHFFGKLPQWRIWIKR